MNVLISARTVIIGEHRSIPKGFTMAKKFAAVLVAFAIFGLSLVGGAGAASATPVSPNVSCGSEFIAAGKSDTCAIGGYTNRLLPLVSATLYPDFFDDFARPALSRASRVAPPAGVRVGTGSFNNAGVGSVSITIPRRTSPGLYYIAFTNLFDSSQVSYEEVFVYNSSTVLT